MTKEIWDLAPKDCRYIISPVNHDRGAVYCAKPVADGSSWCAEHHARCYQRGTASRLGRSPIGLPVDKVDVPVPAVTTQEERIRDLIEEWK